LAREDLSRQLLLVREVDLETLQAASPKLHHLAVVVGQAKEGGHSGLAPSQAERLDLAGLPFRMGADCHLDGEEAANLHVLSRKLRSQLQAAMPEDRSDCRLDAQRLRWHLLDSNGGAQNPWLREEAAPALMQLMQAEGTGVRRLLVQL